MSLSLVESSEVVGIRICRCRKGMVKVECRRREKELRERVLVIK